MSNKLPHRHDRHVTRPGEANTGTFKCDIQTERLRALGGDGLSLVPADDPTPRRCLDDMRRLSEQIKRSRRAQEQTMNGPDVEDAATKDDVEMRPHRDK
jgi:hypothetical protein